MTLISHAILGIIVVGLIVWSNPAIFGRQGGPAFSKLEMLYYAIGLVSIGLGWYFNIQFVEQYADGSGNVFSGNGSWLQFIELGYANPAAASASQDYTIGNVLLLPMFTIIDGYRRGIRRPWLFFIASLFTSFAFAWAFYLATVERQRLREKGPATGQQSAHPA
jgi:hypothetical protein